jgi:hypothetical protein
LDLLEFGCNKYLNTLQSVFLFFFFWCYWGLNSAGPYACYRGTLTTYPSPT